MAGALGGEDDDDAGGAAAGDEVAGEGGEFGLLLIDQQRGRDADGVFSRAQQQNAFFKCEIYHLVAQIVGANFCSLVEDEFDGTGEVEVCSTLPLGGPVEAVSTGPLTVREERGWLSERMFEREPIAFLRAEGRLRLPARAGWRIGLRSRP